MASPSSCPPPLVAADLLTSFPQLSSPLPPPLIPVVEGEDGEAIESSVLLNPENPNLPPAAAAKVLASDDTDDDDVDGAASSQKKSKPLSSFTSLPSPPRHRHRPSWPPSSLTPMFRSVGPNRGPMFDPSRSKR